MFIRKLNTHIILSRRIEKKNISIYSFLCEMFRKGEFIQTAEEWFSKAEGVRLTVDRFEKTFIQDDGNVEWPTTWICLRRKCYLDVWLSVLIY